MVKETSIYAQYLCSLWKNNSVTEQYFPTSAAIKWIFKP